MKRLIFGHRLTLMTPFIPNNVCKISLLLQESLAAIKYRNNNLTCMDVQVSVSSSTSQCNTYYVHAREKLHSTP
ncbi:hypothetical protein EUGRSUZ_C01508 [Eucalyptus grandis]|uniref:Uncharacterized protein n=2 Tax=Eucalyptus grandis TaxID=71139 RepID=A0ACC3LCI5_EUCGR|nr:hypothetical protein EUGRSUZ_C01508 [Eucalyptus grandis]